jgi:hypothetical protein
VANEPFSRDFEPTARLTIATAAHPRDRAPTITFTDKTPAQRRRREDQAPAPPLTAGRVLIASVVCVVLLLAAFGLVYEGVLLTTGSLPK